MPLARHVDPDAIVEKLHSMQMSEQHKHHGITSGGTSHSGTPYGTRYTAQTMIPKFRIPDEGAPGDAVSQILSDELDLDGRTNLNLASFVNTYMEDSGRQLMINNLAKNLADSDEYPALMSLHTRCVSMIADLWHAPKESKPIGTATVGSSEAIHLGGLAMKRRWQEKRRAAGKDTSKPNIIMGSNAQVALLKFARYFEVEARILPVSKESNYRLDTKLVRENLDENTIGIFVILGSTYTGHYEPVEEIHGVLDEFEKETGHDVPIHVDGASGAFVAPFTHAGAGKKGQTKWDFQLPRVVSINTSGHKFGLVLPGLGWIIWRDESYLSKDLIFELHYLGGTEESYTLNFSRPGAQVIGQYFNLIHLGRKGYRSIMENCLSNARLLSQSLEATEWYECLSDIHRPEGVHSLKAADPRKEVGFKEGETSAQYNAGLPVVAFCFSELVRKEYPHAEQEKVSQLMRAKGWIIPNYALPPAEDHQEILRVVVRESMSFDLLDRLIADLCSVTENILKNEEPDFSRVHRSNNIEAVHARAEKERREGEQQAKEGKGKEQEAEKLDKKAESASAKGKKKGKGKSRMPGAIHSSVC